ncbi:hypothetical protein DE146DRAFT_669364 [Phaeosphaeria sp. MPI-PUGE-AT-0046c]|nr:hypothetical protein DE146DRAFT_669364 [Phaeosphaeria sp. MPI-PUGE-AT-0046c]
MARIILPLAAIAAVAPLASAGVSFTKPAAGATLTADTAIEVAWEESGDGPKLADLASFELALCAGGDASGEFLPLKTITTQGSFAVTSIASGLIPATLGEDSPKNSYFLRMQAVGKTGGMLITYSNRFSYSGMTGTFPDIVKKGVSDIGGTTGPKTEDTTVKAGAANPAAPAAGDYGIEYTMQTGLTRYAPMQPVPSKKVTATGNPKPLYPTSSVVIAKTRLPIPSVQTTITQSQTYSVKSRVNTAAPQSHPTDDMAKFLNRWKD